MIKKGCLDILHDKCENCNDCILSSSRKNIVFSDGNPETAKVMFITEVPNELEDEAGKPFVGKVGKLFDKFIEEAGISRENDIYIVNTVKCRPPEHRVPTQVEKSLCDRYLLAQIEIFNPKAIVFCGSTVMKHFTGDKKIQMSKIRGKWFDIEINGRTFKAMTIFHPSYLMRNSSMEEGSPRRLMQEDLAEIKSSVIDSSSSNPFKKDLALV